MIADAAGRAIAFRIAPGQAHELPHAAPLLNRLPGVPLWIVADRGYSSHGFRHLIWQSGAEPAVPSKRNEAPVRCLGWIYNNRSRVERLWRGWKNGAQSPPATRRPPAASVALSASPRPANGSSHNTPYGRVGYGLSDITEQCMARLEEKIAGLREQMQVPRAMGQQAQATPAR
ncbi:hypothetical protein DHODJN_26370 [Methylorubrum extorquens]